MEDDEKLNMSTHHQRILAATAAGLLFGSEVRDHESWHFIHFTVGDFDDGLSNEYSPDEASISDGFGSLEMDSTLSPNWLLLSPGTDCPALLHEPSWFPPLEQSSPLDELLFMYCQSAIQRASLNL